MNCQSIINCKVVVILLVYMMGAFVEVKGENASIPKNYNIRDLEITIVCDRHLLGKTKVVINGGGEAFINAKDVEMNERVCNGSIKRDQVVSILKGLYDLRYFWEERKHYGSKYPGIEMKGDTVTQILKAIHDIDSYYISCKIGEYEKTMRIEGPYPAEYRKYFSYIIEIVEKALCK